MPIAEAIAAARAAGQTTGAEIYEWLNTATGNKVSNRQRAGLNEVTDVLGIVRAGEILAALQAATAGGDTTAGAVVVALTSGGSIETGIVETQVVLGGLATARIITNAERDALIGAGLRDEIRGDAYGLSRVPQPYRIAEMLG